MDTVGRPPLNLDDVFAKIQPFLEVGYSLHKACQLALIPYRAVYDYYKEDENFCNKIERERNMINVVARRNLIEKIRNGDAKLSLEWLDRLEKDEFSTRAELKSIVDNGVYDFTNDIKTPEDAQRIVGSIEAILQKMNAITPETPQAEQ